MWPKNKVETKLLYPYWWSHTTCVYSSQDKFGDRESLLSLSRTTVLQQYCTKTMLILSKTLKIGLLSAKSDLSRTNLLQKVRLRTKVRENRTFWEDCFSARFLPSSAKPQLSRAELVLFPAYPTATHPPSTHPEKFISQPSTVSKQLASS